MRLLSVASLLLLLPVLQACVHREFDYPGDEPATEVDVEVALRYLDLDMPLHTSLDLTRERSRGEESTSSRHIIKIYKEDFSEAASLTLADEAENAHEPRQCRFTLAPGEYTAVCWTEYASADGVSLHYDTSEFPKVTLNYSTAHDGSMVHQGNTPWRDAFSGSCNFSVAAGGVVTVPGLSGPQQQVLVEMRRPMARFVLEATDFDEFATRHNISPRNAEPQARVLQEYSVTLRYNGYMPCVFSALTGVPVDSRVGAAFAGDPHYSSTSEGIVEIASDFVFVNPLETAVEIAVEITENSSGKTVARCGPFEVPLMRNRLTIVRGRFLTSSSGSGILIDTGFSGDYKIKI